MTGNVSAIGMHGICVVVYDVPNTPESIAEIQHIVFSATRCGGNMRIAWTKEPGESPGTVNITLNLANKSQREDISHADAMRQSLVANAPQKGLQIQDTTPPGRRSVFGRTNLL